MAAASSGEQPGPCSGEQPGPPDIPEPEDFVYGEDEFVLQGVSWPGTAPSRFDRALLGAWQDRMARGLFRYRLGELPTRVLPGAMGLVAQLNPQRATQRRPPQAIRSLTQPFDPQQFNFTRIRPGEVLLCLRRRSGGDPPPLDRVLVAINVSPLERGHVLLLPEPALGLPQALTPQLLRFGLEAVLLSTQPGFRVGFNSLGALASVNHLHLHAFYLAHPLRVELAPAEPLLPEGGPALLRDVPAPALLFYTAGTELRAVAEAVCGLAAGLAARGLAYNVFATRGAPPAGGAAAGLRVLLWARRPSFEEPEEPDEAVPAVALCELAGYLPLPAAAPFAELSEAEALRALRRPLLPEPELRRLLRDLLPATPRDT